MDKVIVTALLLIGSVTAALVVMMSVGPSISQASQSLVESNRDTSERIKTNVEIIAVASDSAGTTINAWIKNVGVVPIYAIEKMDIFVITPGIRFDAMTHAANGDNTWTETVLPSAWSRGDTLHITITLPASDPLVSGVHALGIITANGISTEKIFSK